MADIIFHDFMSQLGSGNVNWVTDTVKIALCNDISSYTADSTAWDGTGELGAGNGYTADGETVTGKTITDNDSDDVVQYDMADVTWTASGGAIGPASGAVIYDYTNNSGLIYLIDFTEAKTADDGTDFKITIDSSGLFLARQA